MRILVVDDDPLAGAMTEAILEEDGHEVIFVENGIDAADAISSDDKIEMIISDMNMPLVSGIDLFQTLREQNSKLPFILLTGDDPGPLLQKEPNLDGCLMKDGVLDKTLPAMVNKIS